MSKGITAFIVVVALILSISILSGLDAYRAMGVSYSESANDDVQAAADALVGQSADNSGGSVIEDFTVSAASVLASIWQVMGNLSGILQMLFPLPEAITDPIQLLFQMTFGITFAAFLRGVILQ